MCACVCVCVCVCVCLCVYPPPREAFLCRDVLSPLAELIDESHHACKLNVHRTLNRLANFPSGMATKQQTNPVFLIQNNTMNLESED